MGISARKIPALAAGILVILLSSFFETAYGSRLIIAMGIVLAIGWGGTAREAGWLGALIGAPLGLSAIFRAVRAINLFAGGEFYIHAEAVLIAAFTAAPLAAGAGALLAWGMAKTALRLLPLPNNLEE